MAEFVLVAGAWLGSWAWDDVARQLRANGDAVRALTLSGLAERSGAQVGPRTHVEDVVGEVEGLDLHDVVLVGHSYAGVPVTQAAGLIGDRLKRLVLVDAIVPQDGACALDGWPSDDVREQIARTGVWPVPDAEEFDGQGLGEQQIMRILTEGTPHPGASAIAPAALARPLADLPTTYVTCLLDGDEPPPAAVPLIDSGAWELVTMPTGHWPMFSEPRELARILLTAAGTI